jgi:beta-N-acetylhexosaminidase
MARQRGDGTARTAGMARKRGRGWLLAAVLVIAVAVPVGLFLGRGSNGHAAFLPAAGGRASSAEPSPSATRATLTPRQLAGERVIWSYSGLTPPDSLLTAIGKGEVAGVIFFSDNVSSLAQVHRVADRLQAAAKKSPLAKPLLLLTDQEGGEIRRLPGEPNLSAKQIGQASDPTAAAKAAGTGAADTLNSAGLNVNLAPVLDVYRSPGDLMDQYGRSYSSDPDQVARLGSAFVTAQAAGGVLATAKHFPGLGPAGADQNTDEVPVTLNTSAAQLRSVDEKPYRQAIAAGVPLVMASWATYPALDAQHPAGMSHTIIADELRGRLGFDGVTMTDAMEAGALKPYGDTQHRAVAAAAAGMDLLLCSGRDPAQGAAAVTALAAGYRDGSLDRSDFTAAADRVTELRGRIG